MNKWVNMRKWFVISNEKPRKIAEEAVYQRDRGSKLQPIVASDKSWNKISLPTSDQTLLVQSITDQDLPTDWPTFSLVVGGYLSIKPQDINARDSQNAPGTFTIYDKDKPSYTP